jgi:hypothetical protein
MLITFPSPLTKPDGETEMKGHFAWVLVFPCRRVWRARDWRWCEDHLCRFEIRYLHIYFIMRMLYSHKYWLKLCACYIIQLYISKYLCGSHTKSIWKWILKYADCDIPKRMSSCCLRMKHTQSSNFLFRNKKSSALSLTLSPYDSCCIGEAGSGSSILLFFRRYSDLTVDK